MNTTSNEADCIPHWDDDSLEQIDTNLHTTEVQQHGDLNALQHMSDTLIGKEFDEVEDAHAFYNAYARRTGFSIRRNHTRLSKEDRLLIGIDYVCSREGFRCNSCKERKNLDAAKTRCGYKAMISLKKSDQKWVVCKLITYHNHDLLTPKSTGLLRGHRGVTRAQKSLIDTLNESGVAPRKIVSVLSKAAGGDYNMGCISKDIANYVGNKRRNLLREGGVQKIYSYFNEKQYEDPGFSFTIEVDGNGCMGNCFWADSRSRAAYQYFGDVVTFDATYLINRYGMPFVPFTSVNHHHQSVMFGCALLVNETADSYAWLLKIWQLTMGGCAPTAILTDDDKAMAKAIADVLPNTTHRLCLWHILQKVFEYLAQVYNRYPKFQNEFHHCIHDKVTVQEFELEWGELLVKYALSDNEWLNNLYVRREKWVPAYLRTIFFAGMSTTQRSESMNQFFKDYVRSSTMVSDFVHQYGQALNSRYLKENVQDVKTKNSKPILKTTFKIEAEAAKTYTRKSFGIFQDELFNSSMFKASKDHEEGGKKVYKVAHYEKENEIYQVAIDISEQKATCTCHMFEFVGILCRHILVVFAKKGLANCIPSHYILERWTIQAKSRILSNILTTESVVDPHMSLISMKNNLTLHFFDLVDMGSQSCTKYDHLRHGFDKLNRELLAYDKDIDDGGVGDGDCSRVNSQVLSNRSVHLGNPPRVNSRGRPKSLRKKHPLETQPSKKRKCSICNETGHVRSTCPLNFQARDNVNTFQSYVPTMEYIPTSSVPTVTNQHVSSATTTDWNLSDNDNLFS